MPRKIRAKNLAKGIPMSASGLVLFTHRKKFLRPMPGSITTGQAPSKKSANTLTMSSYPGRTMTKTLSWGLMPRLRRKREHAATSFSNSAKERAGKAPSVAGRIAVWFGWFWAARAKWAATFTGSRPSVISSTYSFSASQRSASIAAWHPIPAAVMA